MSVAVLFPDVEQLLCMLLPSRLAAHGLSYPVGTRVPNPRPAAFWRIEVGGGNRRDLVVDNPTVTVESWAGTETQASLMARTVRAVLESLAGVVSDGAVVYRGRDFSAPANLPDPTSSQVRYTSTGSILLRGAALT